MTCPLDGRSNDPGGGRKQIQLQYAGIGGSYGWASEASGAATFDDPIQLIRCPPIGFRYDRIFNPYLCLARLSESAALRRERLGCMRTSGLRRCCCF
jgi:hypothetical protein